MLGNHRLVSDTMSEVFDLLKPWIDESFWDFSQVNLQPGSVYVIGRQSLLDNLQAIKDAANTGLYTFVTDLCQQDLASFLKECYNTCKYNQQHLAELRVQERQEFPDRFFKFLHKHFNG